jgi:hypothetical protein
LTGRNWGVGPVGAGGGGDGVAAGTGARVVDVVAVMFVGAVVEAVGSVGACVVVVTVVVGATVVVDDATVVVVVEAGASSADAWGTAITLAPTTTATAHAAKASLGRSIPIFGITAWMAGD